ncbi:MAG: VCBS repeat-containing protein, partial [Gemmatimonadetes bacterium]
MGVIGFVLAGMFPSLGIAQPFTAITSGDLVTDNHPSWAGCWGDYDQDGDLDLFVANTNGVNNMLYQNQGDGTFRALRDEIVSNERGYSYDCAWVDYDGDEDLDLFVANSVKQENFLYQNDGKGSFSRVQAGAITTDSESSTSANWGDYNNDGYPDLYVTNCCGEPNSLYQNNGDGTFRKITEGAIVTDAYSSWSSAWGDYDNDGDLDLFVVNTNAQHNALYQNEKGTFVKVNHPLLSNDDGNSQSCTWVDYDRDGYLDLFVTNIGQVNYFYQNMGDGRFQRITNQIITSELNDSWNAVWGDFNQDGFEDVFIANNRANTLYQNYHGQGFVQVALGDSLPEDVSWNGAWGDYDGDGDLDLFVANATENNLFRNDAAQRVLPATAVSPHPPQAGQSSHREMLDTVPVPRTPVPSSQEPVHSGEIPADTTSPEPAIRLGSEMPKTTVYRIEVDGLPIFSEVTRSALVAEEAYSWGQCWGDYNNDGYEDVLVANSGQNTLYRNNGDGTFTPVRTGSSITRDEFDSWDCAWADYDNDGDQDVFVANSGKSVLYRNEGKARFTPIILNAFYKNRYIVRSVDWGDFDNDGYLDLYLGTGSGQPNMAFRNNQDGTFLPLVDINIVSHWQSASQVKWVDYDNDGDVDLFIANCCNENNQLFRNMGKYGFQEIPFGGKASGGNSQRFAWGDYNSDGYLDLIVFN